MRVVIFAIGSALLAGCDLAPAPRAVAFDPWTEEEERAFIDSAEFQSWVIYDCDFEPDAEARARGYGRGRQIIFDVDRTPQVSYAEPASADVLYGFERSVRGTTEVFESVDYKTILIDEDGSARMSILDYERASDSVEIVATITNEFSGTCRHGAAWPSGFQLPWCPADPALAEEACLIWKEQSDDPTGDGS